MHDPIHTSCDTGVQTAFKELQIFTIGRQLHVCSQNVLNTIIVSTEVYRGQLLRTSPDGPQLNLFRDQNNVRRNIVDDAVSL